MGRIVVLMVLVASCNAVYDLDPTTIRPGAELVDDDGDTIDDSVDNCIGVANPTQNDEDSDTRGDLCDNCPLVGNFDQADRGDGDGVGDRCDPHPTKAGDCLRLFDSFTGPFSWDVVTDGGAATPGTGMVTLAPAAAGRWVSIVAPELDGVFDVQVFGFVTLATNATFAALTNISAVSTGYGCGVENRAQHAMVLLDFGTQPTPFQLSPPVGTVALIRYASLSDARAPVSSCRVDYGVAKNAQFAMRTNGVTSGHPGALAITSHADVHAIAVYEFRTDNCKGTVWR